MEETERIIRIARIPDSAHPLPSGFWGDGVSVRAGWAAIAIVLQERHRVPNYHLYWLGDDGEMLDLLDYESMEIALDQARVQAHIQAGSWRKCKIPVYVDRRIDRVVFSQYAFGTS